MFKLNLLLRPLKRGRYTPEVVPVPAVEELHALFAAMTDRVLVMDRDGRYLRIQETNAPKIYDDSATLLGKTLYDVRSPQRAELLVGTIRRSLATKSTVAVEYALEPPNDDRWMLASISPLSDETVLVVIRDISERVHASNELERRVDERTRELTALIGISRNIGSTLELSPLLELIIEHVKEIVDYARCSIYFLEGEELKLLGSKRSEGTAPVLPSVPVSSMGPIWSHLAEGKAAILGDIRDDSEMARVYRAVSGEMFETASEGISSWMGVALVSKDRIIGMLTLSHPEPSFYGEHHAALVSAIAVQAAIAIENARLHAQTLRLATMEERQRLARELHDSVSQALYGIALGARTARKLIEDDSRAVQPVEYVMTLAETGMAEMRALIFELRPESLEMEGLVAAILKQVAAISSRYEIEVLTELCAEPGLNLAEKEVFYRIGQEALHNIVKHAKATTASVRLASHDSHLELEVVDNGAGFDTGASFPGHIGLLSMKERAASIGAAFEVVSSPGNGTVVRLRRPH